ncbi:hypothetical protein MMC20_005768 [Loxospora ochrophaea]|nr:hypothetical protein [Loxospora ochrophaea]
MGLASQNATAEKETVYHELNFQNAPEVVPPPSDPEVVSSGPNRPDSTLPEPVRYAPYPKHQRESKGLRGWKLWAVILGVLAVAIVAGVVGGVLGSRAKSSSPAPSSTASASVPLPTSSGSDQPANNATAHNGTAISVVGYVPTSDATDSVPQNYIVFYQHSNGEIRKLAYNSSQWYDSELVVRDARLGTGLASTWLGQTQELYVYYIDKNDVLQEIRGKHASNSWTNGTLGQASIVASSGYSDVAADYIGVCGNSNMSYVIYHSGNGGEAQVALWTQTNDSWSRGASTFDVAPQKSFSALLQDDVWRFYGTVNSANQLSEYACGDCCNSPDLSDYQPDLEGPKTSVGALGLSVAKEGIFGNQRLLYYVDSNGSIRELNNTGNLGDEFWVANVSYSSGTNQGQYTNTTIPAGQVVARDVMSQTRLGSVIGSHHQLS